MLGLETVVHDGTWVPSQHERGGDPSIKIAREVRKAEKQEFITKDSGKRDQFETGAQRDTQEGKGRYDLVPSRALRRIAQLYERGAKKYDENNWRKGMPFRRVIDSMIRHAEQYKDGKVLAPDVEDHLAAVAWNAITLMEYEEAVRCGQLPASRTTASGTRSK